MASPGLDEITTTTLRYRSGKLRDNMSKNIALLMRLQQKENIAPVSGGRTIVEELEYAENSTFMYYSGDETLNISASDVFTSAEFDWKQTAVAVKINGLELLKNSGREKVIDLLEARIKNAEKTFMNGLAYDVYSAGTLTGQISGLANLVASSPATGIVGGIDRATWSFWQNVAYSGVTNGGAAVSASNIQAYMTALAIQLVRGPDKVDLISAGNNYFQLYVNSLQAIQRVTDETTAGSGFAKLKFYGGGQSCDVVLDGGIGSSTYNSGTGNTNLMYFLNTSYIFFRPHRDRNFVPIGGERQAVNQDAVVKLIGWAGNLTCSGAQFQGVLSA